MDTNLWITELTKLRREKDIFFATSPESPLAPEERSYFRKLSYFSPDSAYRFELTLHEHEQKEHIEIEDTAGQIRDFLKWGEFRFEINGVKCTLQAYANDPVHEGLFIPFKDETNGIETYGAGRYLDLGYDRDRTTDGKWVLDFNKAYNPWCAYSNDYACPFVPQENRLEVSIRAGEKGYRKPEAFKR
ncbi:MAG: DUF1684 domain-containing protein [Candidatus Diapherotrites archaeon]|nr:DUF1684 domain-containing protein [Candidatus Diapherotrites archaeon]